MTWNQERHDAARARCEAATEGPWSAESHCTDAEADLTRADGWDLAVDPNGGNPFHRWDADFIAAARQDLPDALDEIERLRRESQSRLAAYCDISDEVESLRAQLSSMTQQRDYWRDSDLNHGKPEGPR